MTAAVRDQLAKAGYWPLVSACQDVGNGLSGVMDLAVLPLLQADPQFYPGPLHGLHKDVGAHRADFRSRDGAFGPDSLQIVINTETGQFWADIDKFNPYGGLAPLLAHGLFQVIPGFFRGLFGRKKKDA